MTWVPVPTASIAGSFKQTTSQTPNWKVWTIQLNLPVTADGLFGPLTAAAVKKFQTDQGFALADRDGIVGPQTQRALVIARSASASSQYTLPAGLLSSVSWSETGYYIPATSGLTYDGGRDYGAYQEHRLNPSEAQLIASYRIAVAAATTAERLRRIKNKFFTGAIYTAAKTHENAWKFAALYHNWQHAAERLAQGKTIYLAPGSDDQPKQWIIDATNGRLQTPNQWVAEQIEKKTAFVTNWTP